jgi:tetratricopeptide (TPR) repeat protein
MKRVHAALVFATVLAGCSAKPEPAAEAPAVPLYDNVGQYSRTISTSSPDAQKYFDQGLAFSYAFNHAEAIRAFRYATELDPACAMCYWGIAYALGPNINAPISEEAARDAWPAIRKAVELSAKATENERALIEALARRYAEDPAAAREPLDRAYAEAMRDVVRRFPDDDDAATLFAQSVMDTSPWNYWEADGRPRPGTTEVLEALERVLARTPDHAGAIHLYIHAVEASPDPARAERHADRLAGLMPGAGHIVHMPGHIYLRVGRYGDASRANDAAIAADEAYFATDAAAGNMMYEIGYHPHNMHFKALSAALEGRRADALQAAANTHAKMHADMLHDPAMGGMVQHMRLTPLYTKLRFAMWDEVLAEPEPPTDLPFTRAIWHAARGMAFVATGRIDDAEAARTTLESLKDDPSFATLYVSSVNTASKVVPIAYEVLAGQIAAARKRGGEAARHFARAVALEDALTYMEPPDWFIPVRQLQGTAMLQLGRAGDAETAFRRDLVKFPNNGWSLSGLEASLARQGRTKEAAAVREQFGAAWKNADVQLTAGAVVREPEREGVLAADVPRRPQGGAAGPTGH